MLIKFVALFLYTTLLTIIEIIGINFMLAFLKYKKAECIILGAILTISPIMCLLQIVGD